MIFLALVVLVPLAWWIKHREDRRNVVVHDDEIRPRPSTDATKPPTWGPGPT